MAQSIVATGSYAPTYDGSIPWNTGQLNFGLSTGSSGSMTVSDGAVVNSTSGFLGIAQSSIATATITGAGSAWNSNVTFVGSNSLSNCELLIENGGAVNSSDFRIGNGGLSSGAVVVDGSAINTNLLRMALASGNSQTPANSTLRIVDGGSVESSQIVQIGFNSGFSNSEVEVDGADSTLCTREIADDLEFGSLLNIFVNNGGAIFTERTFIGNSSNPASQRNILIRGAGSRWVNSDFFRIGVAPTFKTIDEGGLLSTFGNAQIFREGTTVVTGDGSQWQNEILSIFSGTATASENGLLSGTSISVTGSTGTLILDGGNIYTGSLSINSFGSTFNHLDGTLTIDGGTFTELTTDYSVAGDVASDHSILKLINGATWDHTGSLAVGDENDGTFDVESGAAVVVSDRVDIGAGTAGATGTVNISGEGSVLDVQLVEVGSGEAGILNVSDFGTFISTFRLSVGHNEAANGTINIGSGGFVSVANNDLSIGHEDGATGSIFVDDSQSTVFVSDDAFIGLNGQGTVDVTAGLFETADDVSVGHRVTGVGSLTVDSSGTLLADLVRVATEGHGTMNVFNGGVIDCRTGRIAQIAGAVGEATLDGVGSVWDISENLYVGGGVDGPGGSGTLDIQNGAELNVGLSLVIYEDGQLNFSDGRLAAASLDLTAPTATEGFNMTGGRLVVDSVLGNLTQNGGTLAPGDSPGTTNIQGDFGLDAGDLEIEIGGTAAGTEHDQLVVSGDVHLSGDLMTTLVDGFLPKQGQQYLVVDVGGLLTGTFNALPEGAMAFSQSGIGFFISYLGGDGNDIVLNTSKATVLLGDVNLDGEVNLLDVAPFVSLLATSQFQQEADVNQDGAVDLLDVTPFVELLSGG